MTQLDVPNISFVHYLDLLKRRTWHVVIVSIIGLIVGGMVAMLIPRYYVAGTKVEFSRAILDPMLGTPVDPMESSVTESKMRVPTFVPQAIANLNWPEGAMGDAETRRVFVDAVKKRVRVDELGPVNPNRRVAFLMIRYADQNGPRSAEMANELRKLWLADVVEAMKKSANSAVQRVQKQKRELQAKVNEQRSLLRAFEQENEIDPGNPLSERSGGLLTTLSQDIRVAMNDESRYTREGKGLEKSIAGVRFELDVVKPTLPVSAADRFDSPVLAKEYRTLQVKIYLRVKMLKDVISSRHPQYESNKLALESDQSRLIELEKIAGGAAISRPNPAYQEVQRRIREFEHALELARSNLEEVKKQLVVLRNRKAVLPAIFQEYNGMREDLVRLVRQVDLVDEELNAKRKLAAAARPDEISKVVSEAWVPPRPTDPNPLMLSLIGCLVGLGVALSLVVLIDFLQMTFKSVSEVESALALPVLGTVGYMETEAEIQSTRSRRMRMTVVGVSFLLLILTVITLFYVQKSSLPRVVVTILEALLGKPS